MPRSPPGTWQRGRHFYSSPITPIIHHPSPITHPAFSLRFKHDLATHHGDDRPDVFYLPGRDREVIAVEDEKVGVLSRRKGTEIGLLEHDKRVRPGVGDQRFLAG